MYPFSNMILNEGQKKKEKERKNYNERNGNLLHTTLLGKVLFTEFSNEKKKKKRKEISLPDSNGETLMI